MKRGAQAQAAFSLMELLVALGVIAILVTLSFPLIGKLRARAQRIQCMTNLRGLHTGAALYLQEHGMWPQISADADEDGSDYAQAWMTALQPFSVADKTWICPTIQNLLGNPDLTDPANMRTDYVATPFDDKPTTPHKWARQPWFVEVGDVHGNGNLIIFADGSILDLKTVAPGAGSK